MPMECAALADGTKPEDPCHPERPLIEVRNQVTQVIQDGQGCRQQHGKNHRDIIYLYQKTHDLDSDIRRIDSATSSHGIDCLAQLASIEAQRAFTAEHTEERLSSVENRASDVDVGHRVLQQQHQDLQANVRRTDQEVEQRCSNTERGVDTLKQKLDLLEETMKQSRGELEQVLASRDAMRDRLHSAVRCLERDVRRFRPPEVTLDQIDFSRLTISSGSPASEKDEQAIHDTMDARIQELERHQASSSASFTLFRGYSDRQASRIARIERLCRAGRNRSSRGLEAIKQQLVEWESRMQGVDATLTALDAVHNDHQARLVAAEEARLALHQASDQAQQEIDSRFEEHLGTFRRADNELNNVVAMQSSHSCRIEGLRAEMASLDQENSNRWTSVTQNVNDAIEGNVATGKMSRQLAELETQIQLLTRQIASSRSLPHAEPTPTATPTPPPTQQLLQLPADPRPFVPINMPGEGEIAHSTAGIHLHSLPTGRRSSSALSSQAAMRNRRSRASMCRPPRGTQRCTGGRLREYCPRLRLYVGGARETTPWACTKHFTVSRRDA